jgi:hypothetical protein
MYSSTPTCAVQTACVMKEKMVKLKTFGIPKKNLTLINLTEQNKQVHIPRKIIKANKQPFPRFCGHQTFLNLSQIGILVTRMCSN